MSTTTAPTPELTSYEKKLRRNLRYYHKRYNQDEEFRNKEIQRNSDRIKDKYTNDPEFRQKMIDNAKARYQRLKKQKEQVSQ